MPFLPEAIDSIMAQTLKDFHLLIIDDGSTDGSADYLEIIKDSRVKIIRQENQGLGATLNRAIELCETKYMMRMDCDDVMAPTRLQEQLEYMEKHEDVVMLGTQQAFIAGGRVVQASKLPLEHDDIDRFLLSGSGGVCHASFMLRTDAVRTIGGYHVSGAGQGFDFCLRLAEVGRVANLDRVLYYYRILKNTLALSKQDEIRCAYAYAIECARCRRNLLVEPKYSDFLLSWKQRDTFTKISNKIEDWSGRQYRLSIIDKGHERNLRRMARLFFAAALRPRYSLKKLLGRL